MPAVARGQLERAKEGPLSADASARMTDANQTKRKLSYNEQRELERLPARIEALETEQATLKAEMDSREFYKSGADHIQRVMTRLDEASLELEQMLERWMELEERK